MLRAPGSGPSTRAVHVRPRSPARSWAAPTAAGAMSLPRRGLLLAGVRLDRRAGAHEVAVAVGVVHPADRRPELVLARPGRGEGGLLATVLPLPSVARDHRRGMGRVLERIVLAVEQPALDLLDLRADRDERVAEAVELRLGL